MELTRRAHGFVLVAGLVLSGCHTRVDGVYRLDLEQTKQCVEKTAAADAEAGQLKDQTIKLLEATQVELRLDPDGKLLSTTVLSSAGPATAKTSGTWQVDGKRVTFKVPGDADTSCDVDGDRLRCEKQTANKLFGHYVLVRK